MSEHPTVSSEKPWSQRQGLGQTLLGLLILAVLIGGVAFLIRLAWPKTAPPTADVAAVEKAPAPVAEVATSGDPPETQAAPVNTGPSLEKRLAEADALLEAYAAKPPKLAAPMRAHCVPPGDMEVCPAAAEHMIRDWWPAAWKGDYQSQRAVAGCLSTMCDGAVKHDALLACTWRLVILVGGDLQAGSNDASSMERDCGELGSAEQALAKTKAVTIAQMIPTREAEYKPLSRDAAQ